MGKEKTPTRATLILPYYDNPRMLQDQYASIRALPAKLREHVQMIVVDDGSPRWPATPAELDGAPLQVYRIDVDIRWNQDAARNIGAHHCETNWMLLTDIDHLVPRKTWEALLTRDYDRDIAYRFSRVSAPEMEPYKFHPNSWWLTKRLYQKLGGYDERFAGWYGTDADFRDRVATTAKETIQLKEVLIRVPRTFIPDASTTTYLRKQPEDRANIHRIRTERAKEKWKPLNLTFPYHRVHP